MLTLTKDITSKKKKKQNFSRKKRLNTGCKEKSLEFMEYLLQLMKNLIVLFFLAAATLAQQPSTQSTQAHATVQNPGEANAQQARKVIDQCIKALGGNAYLTYTDVDQQGRGYGFYQNAPQGVGVPYERKYRYPDKERYEFLKKHDWILIHNGDKGFEVTFRGVSLEESKALQDYLRRRDHSLEWVVRRWLNEPGIALFYEGQAIAAAPRMIRPDNLTGSSPSSTPLRPQPADCAAVRTEPAARSSSHRWRYTRRCRRTGPAP